MPDRSWERGLHQLIEAKEGCDITQQNETMARISYQRFFRRYCHLAGMSGTLREVAKELWDVYRLRVVTIPPNRPVIRQARPYSFTRAATEKWQVIVERIRQEHQQGRPVLVGTRSVASSELLSALLRQADLPHQVLNARQDKEEAAIVAEAGKGGRIMVATNMAGRGTDIHIEREVALQGGLHVIATELHDTRRIDRQLFGRCGRQGDPGSFEAVVSLEDELYQSLRTIPLAWQVVRWIMGGDSRVHYLLALFLTRFAQWRIQRRNFQVRRQLLHMDEQLESSLAFAGRGE
jgi:preprotein translocase subunit SecA